MNIMWVKSLALLGALAIILALIQPVSAVKAGLNENFAGGMIG